MSDALSVTRATPDGLPRIAPLWRALVTQQAQLHEAYAVARGAETAWQHALGRRMREERAAIFVGTRAGEPEGFVSVERADAPAPLAEVGRAELTELFVAPAARRAGLGRALVESALGWVRAQRIVRVEVRVASANAEGQAFWRALGWGDFVDVLERRL